MFIDHKAALFWDQQSFVMQNTVRYVVWYVWFMVMSARSNWILKIVLFWEPRGFQVYLPPGKLVLVEEGVTVHYLPPAGRRRRGMPVACHTLCPLCAIDLSGIPQLYRLRDPSETFHLEDISNSFDLFVIQMWSRFFPTHKPVPHLQILCSDFPKCIP